MRLTTKFVLACTLASSFIATIITAATPIDKLTIDSTADQITLHTHLIALKSGQRAKLESALASSASVKVIADAKLSTRNGTYTITFENGASATITVAEDAAEQSLSLAFTNAPSPSAITTIDVDSVNFEVTTGGNAVTITDAKIKDGQVSSISGFPPGVSDVIKACITSGGLFSTSTGLTAAVKGTAAAPAEYHFCYAPSDKNFMLCVKKGATGTIAVSVRPKVVGGSALLNKIAGPVIVVLSGAILSVLTSHIFAAVDPEGYQAGKDASSLPKPLKDILADAEGFGDGDLYGDEENQEIYKVDPSTGRTIRLKKDGTVLSNDNRDGSAGEETTDASTFTLVAALFAIPFLL